MLTKKDLNRKDLKVSFVFVLISAIAGILLGLYTTTTTDMSLIPMSKPLFILVSVLQVAILYGFVQGYLGLKLSRAVSLNDKGILGSIYSDEKYILNKQNILISIGFGLLNATVITFSEKFIFSRLIPELQNSTQSFSPLYLLSGIVYGGVVEEIMLRLFLMSLIVLIFYKVFARTLDKKNIPSWIYWASIIISSLLFGLAHLPAASMYFAITPVVIFRIILLNSFAGLLFGYLYWKKGFEYGIIAHMFSHIFMQLVLLPILY